MTNSEDPDQTAHCGLIKEQSDQDLYCFVSLICPTT